MRRLFSFLLILLLTVLGTLPWSPFIVAAQSCTNNAEIIEQSRDPATGPVAPDAALTTSWTLHNSGNCAWSRNYRLIFVSGERMDGPRTMRLSAAVEPGNTVTFSLDLTAPGAEGTYTGTWQLRSDDGDNFGPPLTLAVEVVQSQDATVEVALPQVLVFGGMGAAPDAGAITACAVDDENGVGALPDTPTLITDDTQIQYRYVVLNLCGLSEGAKFAVTLTAPDGNMFTRLYVQGPPTSGEDDNGNQYTGTVTQIYLNWLTQAPAGEWIVNLLSDELTKQITLPLPEAVENMDMGDFARLDNWPNDPIDPFAAAGGCHYQYIPGQAMTISGRGLTVNTPIRLGIYHNRLGRGYYAGQSMVQSDEQGSFIHSYKAPAEPGDYDVVTMQEVDPAGYHEDGVQYDLGSAGGQSAFTCFTVALPTEPNHPTRLALTSGVTTGEVSSSDIMIYDYDTGASYYPTYSAGCDARQPGWWRNGEWVLYQSNCVMVGSGDDARSERGNNYDLYSVKVSPDEESLAVDNHDEDALIRLTETPDLDETEPDGNSDGLIVYRQAPAGTPSDQSGELWLLDSKDGITTSLGLTGSAATWSPDGRRIAFMSDLSGYWQIYVYNLGSKKLSLISVGCRTQCRMPAWSPDGKQIVYEVATAADDLAPAALWIANTTGAPHPRRFLTGPYSRPTWSANGWIAFEGPEGIDRAQAIAKPQIERFLFSDPNWAHFYTPVWSH